MRDAVASMSSLQGVFDEALARSALGQARPGRCEVALIDVAAWRPWLGDAEALLDAAESARMRRQLRSDERHTRAIAYALHRLLVGAAMGCPARDVSLIRDAIGCPRLSDGAMHVSLSHADGRVALAMAVNGPVGVDLEPLSRAPSMREIAAHVCHRDELAAFASLDSASFGSALLALWVRKEALLKSAGVGLGREMTTFVAPAGVLLSAWGDRAATTVIRMLDAGSLYCAAVAADAADTVVCQTLRPG